MAILTVVKPLLGFGFYLLCEFSSLLQAVA